MDALHEVVEYLQMNQIYVGIFCAIVGVGVAGYAYVSRRRSKDKDENEDINNNAGNNSQFTISEVSVGSISPCKIPSSPKLTRRKAHPPTLLDDPKGELGGEDYILSQKAESPEASPRWDTSPKPLPPLQKEAHQSEFEHLALSRPTARKARRRTTRFSKQRPSAIFKQESEVQNIQKPTPPIEVAQPIKEVEQPKKEDIKSRMARMSTAARPGMMMPGLDLSQIKTARKSLAVRDVKGNSQAKSVPKCDECQCDDFIAHMFKPTVCRNCQHVHNE